MPHIRLEFVPVETFALGWLGFDHLQLVFEPDGSIGPVPQDDWFVLEGCSGRTRTGPVLSVIGTNGHTTLSEANGAIGDKLVQIIGTPQSRGSRILPVAGDIRQAWECMIRRARAINSSAFPYRFYGCIGTPFLTINSSSVIASVLWQIGIDINDHLPTGMGLSPGTQTLLGTVGGGQLSLGTGHFDTLAGGAGDDVLLGTDDPNRVDKLFGGAGNDIFHWSVGHNIVHGGLPGLSEAEDGIDIMDYRGAGVVTIDRGRRVPWSRSPQYVVSFTGAGAGGGVDWLTSIEVLRFDPTTDTLVVGKGLKSIPRALLIDMQVPRLEGDEWSQSQPLETGGLIDCSQAGRGVSVVARGLDEVELHIGRSSPTFWSILGGERLIGSAHDDHIQMSRFMHVAEGGEGDDIIDARLVEPAGAGRRYGYDAEIDGGSGDDVLIASVGRTYARGGAGANTFILPRLAETGEDYQTELIIADAKPDDCLLVPEAIFSLTGEGGHSRLRRMTGRADMVLGPRAITCAQEGSDLVIKLANCGNAHENGPNAANIARAAAATIRVLNYRLGDLGLDIPAAA